MQQTINILNKYYQTLTTEIAELQDNPDPKYVFKKDVRGQVFAIEGMLRLHLNYPKSKLNKSEKKKMEKVLAGTKEIEDALGKYSLVYELAEYTSSSGGLSGNGLVKDQINKDKISAFNNLVTALAKYQKKLKKHQAVLAKIKLPKKEEKFIKKAMKSEIHRTKDKIKEDLKPLILADTYGHEELEEGFHEFRRAIRWVSIYIQGYKQFFSLAPLPKKLSKREKYLVKQYKNNPFCQFTDNQDLILLDPIKYYQLSDYISIIGKIKTEGEMRYYLKERYNAEPSQGFKLESLAHKNFNHFLKDKVFHHLFI